ncbi:TPA: hypothetical protein ACGBHZ_006011, partial [Pseudomonas aeruginosa]
DPESSSSGGPYPASLAASIPVVAALSGVYRGNRSGARSTWIVRVPRMLSLPPHQLLRGSATV